MQKIASKLAGWIPPKLKWAIVYGSVLVFLIIKSGITIVGKMLRRALVSAGQHQALIIIALLLILVVLTMARSNSGDGQSTSPVITYSTDDPDEVKPTSSYKWRGSPDDPKKIILPSIDTEGYIQKVGIDQNQQIAVPSNIHIAGWFTNTVRPGQNGLSIIDGHVDGRSSDAGIFKKLKDLQADQEFTIQMGNDQSLKYKVLSVKSIKTEEAGSQLFSQNPDVMSQLNLITCGGKFDRDSRQYEERVIVSSQLIEGRY